MDETDTRIAELAEQVAELRKAVDALTAALAASPVVVPVPISVPSYPAPQYPWYPGQPQIWCSTNKIA